MIIADPKSDLGNMCRIVDELKPGQTFKVDLRCTHWAQSFEHNGGRISSADRVLRNILGSAETHSYEVDGRGFTVFSRL